MTITTAADGSFDMRFDNVGTGRTCGGCKLCCKLLPIPVAPLHKPAGVRCVHSRTACGCAVYEHRPVACRTFFCRWLSDPETANLARPDRAHYVLDTTPDYVTLQYEDGETRVSVVQIWVDPAFPNAWKAPQLRAWMQRIARQYRFAFIVRWNSTDALTVFPPELASDNQWHEVRGSIDSRTPVEAEVLAMSADNRDAKAVAGI